jgi:hypothetical protein
MCIFVYLSGTNTVKTEKIFEKFVVLSDFATFDHKGHNDKGGSMGTVCSKLAFSHR